MVEVWISVSLLALTGWQGYRLGREYGWWGKPDNPPQKQDQKKSLDVISKTRNAGLGQSKTDFSRLLTGFESENPNAKHRSMALEQEEKSAESFIIEPATTLMEINGQPHELKYPEETDQIPDSCARMENEEIQLNEGNEGVGQLDQPVVGLNDYVKRVRTVQRKMSQLTKRRKTDTTFLKQELGLLIETYQLENDQTLDWLFKPYEPAGTPDYGSIFDRIENLAT